MSSGIKKKIEDASPTLAVVVFIAAIIITMVTIAAVVAVIVTNPGATAAVIVAVLVGLAIVAAVIILVQIFVAIRYAARGPQTQTDKSYSIDDQEHAESFDEAKDAPSLKK